MDEAILTAFTTATTTVQSDVTAMIVKALPAALSIMGLLMAIRIGVKFFKSVAK